MIKKRVVIALCERKHTFKWHVCVMWRRYVNKLLFVVLKSQRTTKGGKIHCVVRAYLRAVLLMAFIQVDVVRLGFEAKENVDVFRKYSSN